MRRLKYRIVPISLAPVSAALLPGAAVANVGDIEMHTGVTVTHNVTFRVESAGTTSTGANSDDGARHHGKGIAAEFKANAERLDILALTHGFVDFENQRRALNHISLTDGSGNVAGRVLDLCAATTVDAGNQVPNRGESPFLRNGVGVIDPFDVDLFRTPAPELHDGSVPVSMASIAFGASTSLPVEGFYRFPWQKNEIGAGITEQGRMFGLLAHAINADFRPAAWRPMTLVSCRFSAARTGSRTTAANGVSPCAATPWNAMELYI